MNTQRILAEETVSVTEMRKHPADYFTDHPIAVLSNNQTAGYMVGKELFESMISMIRQLNPSETFTAKFQPTATQLREISRGSAAYLSNEKIKDPGKFVE